MTAPENIAVISDIGRRYLHLQLTSHIGPIRLRKLVEHFGSLDSVQSASVAELQCVNGIGPAGAEAIYSTGEDVVDEEVAKAEAAGLRILAIEDDDYPAALRNIPDPPSCLYVRGTLIPTDGVAVAMVGTRRCSHYACEQTIRFAEALAGAGFTIVSGLARGIDGYAHRGALNCGGRTIAVLGNGLPEIYPSEHADLAAEVAENGAVITESPVGTEPSGDNFPRRNRIIAGLSLGVIVVEAGKRSGALITARLATEYNREVFAVPGRVDHPEHTAGVHALIRDGQAKLITCLDDVLDELDRVGEIMRADLATTSSTPADGNGSAPSEPEQTAKHGLTQDEQAIYQAVIDELDTPDRIGQTTGLQASRVMASLTSLQLKGRVRQLPGNRFVPRSSA